VYLHIQGETAPMLREKTRLLLGVAAFAFALSVSVLTAWQGASGQAQTFTVTNQFMTAYLINGQPNPTLTLTRGQTYTFAVNAPPSHLFWIKTAQVTGTGSAFNDGVTNNGTMNGTLTFTVPNSAPSTLFYQCQVHAVMTGTILIVNSVPTTQDRTWLMLGALLALCAGVFALTRRRGSIVSA
jgi:hypothetical protein